MNGFFTLFAAVMAAGTISSAALLPDAAPHLKGIDVRAKDDQYVLYIGKENIVLEEREYKLMKLEGHKEKLVSEGRVVAYGSDMAHDTEAIWVNDKTELKIGKMVGSKAPKQVVVLKLKDQNRTFAFEMFHELE